MANTLMIQQDKVEHAHGSDERNDDRDAKPNNEVEDYVVVVVKVKTDVYRTRVGPDTVGSDRVPPNTMQFDTAEI